MFVYISLCVYVCLSMSASVSLCLRMCLCLFISVCVCLRMSVCLCLHMCICLFICVCVYVCLSMSVSVSLCLHLCLSVCRYTLFYNGEIEGGPVVKPLWVDFPQEKAVFGVEDEHLLGKAGVWFSFHVVHW